MKYFSIAMLIIGTIIGAGFASGREIVSFFGASPSLWIAPICGIIIFLLSAMFMFIGSKVKATDVSVYNKAISGRAHIVFDILLLVNSFIVLGSMLAGMDSLGGMIFPLKPLYSIVAGILCILVVCKGINGLLNCNKIVVPIIVLMLVAVCFITIFKISSLDVSLSGITLSGANGSNSSVKNNGFSFVTLISIINYICMNMMLASTVLTTMGKLDKKTIFISSAIAATIMAFLILFIISAIKSSSSSGADMPILDMAKKISPIIFGLIIIVIAISIFTTMLTAMSGLVTWFSTNKKNKYFSATVVLLAALALSNIGFSNVIDYLYPVIGVVGVIYTLFGIIFVVRNTVLAKPSNSFLKERDTEVHERRKHAQNKS